MTQIITPPYLIHKTPRTADLTFHAPLTTTLVPLVGGVSPTFTRSGATTVKDFEGHFRSVLGSEARFWNARRVHNRLNSSSEDLSVAAWTLISGATRAASATAPAGVGQGWKVTASGADQGVQNSVITALNQKYRLSCWLRTDSATSVKLGLRFETAAPGSVTVVPTTTWQRFSTMFTPGFANLEPRILAAASGDFEVAGVTWELVTAQTNQNPSEYVSVGVESSPYFGANVDAVQYFDTENGNTVTSNVVTAGTGTAISTCMFWHENSRTNWMWPSADFTNARWGADTAFTLAAATSLFDLSSASKHTDGGGGGSFRTQTAATTFSTLPFVTSYIVENVDATVTDIAVWDDTAAATVVTARFTWSTHGASITAGAGRCGANLITASGPNGGEVYMIWASGTGTNTNVPSARIYPSGSDVNTKAAILHHGQLEPAWDHPTCPHLNTSGVSTRQKEALTYPLPAAFNQNAGTMVASGHPWVRQAMATLYQYYMMLDDGTFTVWHYIALDVDTAGWITETQINNGNVQAHLSLGAAATDDTTYTAAYAYTDNDFRGVVDGGSVASDAAGTTPTTLNRIQVGTSGSGNHEANGGVFGLKVYSTAKSDSELQQLTT